jgi:hypothetical protein
MHAYGEKGSLSIQMGKRLVTAALRSCAQLRATEVDELGRKRSSHWCLR